MNCLGPVVVRIQAKSFVATRKISKKTEDLLVEASDVITLSAAGYEPKAYIEMNADPLTDDDITTSDVDLGWKKEGTEYSDEWTKKYVKEYKRQVSPLFSTSILGKDDFFTKYTCTEKILSKLLSNKILFPIKDTAVYTDDNEILTDMYLGEGEGQALPKSYNTDFNMQTDASFSRIFFYGMGATLLAAQDENAPRPDLGPFVVDLPLQDLEVRKGFRRYGVRIHFNAEQEATAIHDYANETTIKPGEDGWDQAKWLAKVNTFFLVTAREHLVWTHLIVSNAATRESTVELPPNHPLRRLLTIFTFRSTEVNHKAFDSLVPLNSFFHRSCALTDTSFTKLFDSAYASSNVFEPFPDRQITPALQELSDQGKFPFISEGCEYYMIVTQFVEEWISNAGVDKILDERGLSFYENMRASSLGQKYEIPAFETVDDMVNLVSQIIFTVTAYHELVGHVVDYTSDINRAGFRIAETDETTLDVQALLLTGLISASTSVRMPPLMAEYKDFFGAGGAPRYERVAWDAFVSQLKAQSKKVQENDSKREVEFKYFDPARFESAVSV